MRDPAPTAEPATAHAVPLDYDAKSAPHIGGTLPALMLGAIGVVFGDIGTSPLYALQATLDPRYHPWRST